MRPLDPVVTAEKNKASNRPIFLYTIYDYDGEGTNLNFAGHDVDVSFNGITYLRFPITHDLVNENSTGQIDIVKVKVGNVNKLVQGFLEFNDFRGKRVDIITVFSGNLGNANYKAVDTFYIDSYTSDQSIVEFSLSSKFDILDVSIPQRKFMRNFCAWDFKSTECGYTGSEEMCSKLKQDCKNVKHNFSRFGGFPSIPQQRTYVQ